MGREDGIRQVAFRISHRPGVEYERVRQVSITYDKIAGQLDARLVVEVLPREQSVPKSPHLPLWEPMIHHRSKREEGMCHDTSRARGGTTSLGGTGRRLSG